MLAFITERADKLKSQVEVVVLEVTAQSLKYRPLGFWLQLKYKIIKEILPRPLGSCLVS